MYRQTFEFVAHSLTVFAKSNLYEYTYFNQRYVHNDARCTMYSRK